MKIRKNKEIKNFKYRDEEAAWLALTPAQRLLETTRLWRLYISLGGSLDPEPDPQSPFYEDVIHELRHKSMRSER